MHVVPLALAAILALAGCVGGHAATAGPSSAGPAAGEGTLRGVVVDDGVRPLAKAAVNATGPSGAFNTTTGPDGLFRFDGLAPGVYVVEASKRFYVAQKLTVDVHEGVIDPPAAKIQLTFLTGSVPYANVYKYDGFYECGSYAVRLCSNVNIATWIVVCANTGVCLGNVTQDQSLFFQYIDPGATFIQAELVWEATLATGGSLAFLLGGGNEAELKAGMAPAYNGTQGPSPLMLRISNHESVPNWCTQTTGDETCEHPDILNRSGIGTERALLVQVDAGPTVVAAPSCGVPPETVEPCGAGFAGQQKFSMYTTVFHGYEPPLDWLFTETGAPPPPPTS